MKAAIPIVLVLFLQFYLVPVALAENPHGGYSINTSACAGCHVTHAAPGAKLLFRAGSATAFCLACHGAGGPGSKLDVETGTNWGYSGGKPTTGGGFGTGFTSVHNLDYAGPVPGGGSPVSGGLQCGSCHNPHGTQNARLLREKVNGVDLSAVVVRMEKDPETEQVTAYVSGINEWCAACHPRFNRGEGAGRSLTPGDTRYRHPMGVAVTLPPADGVNFFGGDMEKGTPLESGKLSCLSCHRAHGTKAQMTGFWTAFIGWLREDGTISKSSALLRLDNRGVCFNCHGAAQYNSPGS